MSRFALKIYAVLLIMGAVPLLASAVLISEVLTFDKDLQEEALETLDDVAMFHRAWANAEAGQIELIGELLATGQVLAGDLREPAAMRRAEQALADAVARHNVLYVAELLQGEAVLLSATSPPPPAAEVKLRGRDWPVAGGRTLRLTFGVDRRLNERYEALGERRNLHRGLAALEEEQSGSLSEVSQKFYYLMLALVIVLTVAFAVLITTPVSRRVARLAAATRQVARGDLTVEVPVKGRDELAQLTEQFNRMVSELREARRTLAYMERMSAWQEVARRLAHEIKNPLTPLLLAIQQLDKTFDKYTSDPERYRQLVTEVVEIVTEEVETLRKLVKEFSEFARLPSAVPRPQELWAFVSQTLRSNPQFEESAEVAELGGPEVWAAVDPALMRRVIVNVVQNAIEAVHGVGRRPRIELAVDTYDAGELGRIVVRDNGPGLTDEQKERAFEPYFTTKETGTGLGLAIVRKIVVDHGGDIRLENRSDGESGAEVRISLPVLTAAERRLRTEEELAAVRADREGAASEPAEETDAAAPKGAS